MNRYFKVLVPAFLVGGAVGVGVGIAGSVLAGPWLGAASLVVVSPMFLSFGIVGGTIGAMFFLDEEDDEQPSIEAKSRSADGARNDLNTHNHGAAA